MSLSMPPTSSCGIQVLAPTIRATSIHLGPLFTPCKRDVCVQTSVCLLCHGQCSVTLVHWQGTPAFRLSLPYVLVDDLQRMVGARTKDATPSEMTTSSTAFLLCRQSSRGVVTCQLLGICRKSYHFPFNRPKIYPVAARTQEIGIYDDRAAP